MQNFDLIPALRLVEENPIAQKTFRALTEQLGQSGWAIAKSLDQNPDDIANALRNLTEAGVLRTTDPGLEGNYTLTDLGFALKEQVMSGRFSRSR